MSDTYRADITILLPVLERIADALERAYPQPPPPEPEKPNRPRGAQCPPKSPVLLFAEVPAEKRQHVKSAYSDDERCDAVSRPWLAGLGNRGFYRRCACRKANGDSLCGRHRATANAIGQVSWNEEIA